jgi:hypothetical protein
MELESLKTIWCFGMTYDQYVEGKEVHEHCSQMRFISPALLGNIRNESNS